MLVLLQVLKLLGIWNAFTLPTLFKQKENPSPSYIGSNNQHHLFPQYILH